MLDFDRVARAQVEVDSVSRSMDLPEFVKEVEDRRRDRHGYLEHNRRIDRTRANLVAARKANEALFESIEAIDDALERIQSEAEKRRNGAFAEFAINAAGSLLPIPAELTAGISAGVGSRVRGDDLLSAVLQGGLRYGGTLVALEVSEAIAPPGSESETKSLGEQLFGRPQGRELVADGAGDAIRSLMQAGSEAMARAERGRRLGPAPVAAAAGRPGAGAGPSSAPSSGRPLHVTDRPGAYGPVSFTGWFGVRGPPIDETVGHTLARPGPDAPVITPDLFLGVIHASSERDYTNRLARAFSNTYASRDRRLALLSQRREFRAVRDELAETIEVGELLFDQYQKHLEVYERASEELANQGGGLLGGLVRTLAGIGGSMLGGPVLGAFVAGGVGAAMSGGHPEDVLNAAAASAGYVAGSITLRYVMDELWVGSDDALQSRGARDSVFTPISRVASLRDDDLRTSGFGVPWDHGPDPTLIVSAPDHAPSSRPPSESAPRGRGAGFRAPPPPEALPVEEGIRPILAPWELVGGARAIGAGVWRLGSRAVPWARRHWCKVTLAVNLVVANGQAPDCKPKVRPAGQAVRDQRAKDLLQRNQDAVTKLRNTQQSRPVNPPKR